jgi:3'(2'), 5'-bisphosphate nucleotidase
VTPLLELALQAAGAAAGPMMQLHAGHFGVRKKADGSPVTDADLLAQDQIIQILQSADLPILSEERSSPYEARRGWSRFWLVDPLDGTRDFAVGKTGFTINIALVESGEPTLGVILAPAIGVTWFAARGQGAWRRDVSGTRPISATAAWPAAQRMAVSVFHDTPATAEFGRLNGVSQCVTSGAAIKFALVAESAVEFYARFAGSSEWDIAAGDAILREAGGNLLTVAGKAPAYNKPSLRNEHFVAWRPPLPWRSMRLPVTIPE